MSGSRKSSELRVHAALLAVAALFSMSYIVSKVALVYFSPLAFAWLRVAGAAMLLNAITARVRFSSEDTRKIAWVAVLGVVLNQSLFLAGLALTSAYVAAILITSVPVFALAAAIVAGGERATTVKFVGIALAGSGALLIVAGQSASGSTSAMLGAVLILMNALFYAVYLVVSKPLVERLSPVSVIARMFAVGAILMFPVSAFSLWRQKWSGIPPKAWVALVVVIIGPTVMAYLLNAWALRHAESSLVAAYTYVQPVITTILAAVFLDETLRPVILVAAALIFAGVALAGRSSGPIAE